jgi:phosphoglycolate phosphatase-like HAD superfamily hydrolase
MSVISNKPLTCKFRQDEDTGRVTAEEAIMIGDTPYDALAAKHARVRAIGMLSGGFPRTELEASGCAAVYRDPADLLAHYEETARLLA